MSTASASRITPRALTIAEVEFYRENNYVKLDQLVSEEDAGRLLAPIVERMGPEGVRTFQPGENPEWLKKKYEAPQTAKSLLKWGPIAIDCATGDVAEPLYYGFSHSVEMGALGQQLLGYPVRFWVDESLVKAAGSPETKWHQDSGSTANAVFRPDHGQMMVWLALDHVPPERGSMRFVPPDNQTDEFRRIIAEHDVADSYPLLEELGVITPPFDLRPGDATVHGSRVFHSARQNTTAQPRWAYLVSLFRADATWTGNYHWPLAGVQGLEAGGNFDQPRFREIS
jgi:hypothetical protein